MSISRVKPTNWAINEKLTSSQINQLDTNLTFALDKRSGQTDTLSSAITLSSSGIINTGMGVINVTGVGGITVLNSASTVYLAGSNLSISASAFLTNLGTIENLSGGVISNYGTLNNTSTSTVTNSGTTLSNSGSVHNYATGSQLNMSGQLALTGASTNRIKLGSSGRSLSRIMPQYFEPSEQSTWTRNGGARAWSTTTTNLDFGFYKLNLPDNAVLNSITVRINPANGHGLSAPLNGPAIFLMRENLGNTETLINSLQDNLKGSAYDAEHSIVLSGLSEVIDNNNFAYFVRIFTESGTGAIAGCQFYNCLANCTVSEMDDF